MDNDVEHDQLALIRIEGMHSHKCEWAIQKALVALDGVHEVEVDFASGQASVLFDGDCVAIQQLIDAVDGAGYHSTGVTHNQADATAH